MEISKRFNQVYTFGFFFFVGLIVHLQYLAVVPGYHVATATCLVHEATSRPGRQREREREREREKEREITYNPQQQ